MRHRLISCIDALLVGMILGLLFVTLVHASPASAITQNQSRHSPMICASVQQLLQKANSAP